MLKISEKLLFFSGRIWSDWGYTTWANMAGLGSIGDISYVPVVAFFLMMHADFKKRLCFPVNFRVESPSPGVGLWPPVTT